MQPQTGNDEWAYRKMEESPVAIDFTGKHTWSGIYGLVKDKLGLPRACGENLNALWDMLRSGIWADEPVEVLVYGVCSLDRESREVVEDILKLLDEVAAANPALCVRRMT